MTVKLTIEGEQGSGKSNMMKMLMDFFATKGIHVVCFDDGADHPIKRQPYAAALPDVTIVVLGSRRK